MHGREYESDELASGSENKRRLKKTRESASRERRQKEQAANDHRGKVRFASGDDIQLFAVRDFILVGLEQGGTVESVDPPTGPHLSSKFEVDWQTISLTGQADRRLVTMPNIFFFHSTKPNAKVAGKWPSFIFI